MRISQAIVKMDDAGILPCCSKFNSIGVNLLIRTCEIH